MSAFGCRIAGLPGRPSDVSAGLQPRGLRSVHQGEPIPRLPLPRLPVCSALRPCGAVRRLPGPGCCPDAVKIHHFPAQKPHAGTLFDGQVGPSKQFPIILVQAHCPALRPDCFHISAILAAQIQRNPPENAARGQMVILAMRQIQCWRESKFSKNPNFLGKSQLKNPTSSYLERKKSPPGIDARNPWRRIFFGRQFFPPAKFLSVPAGKPLLKNPTRKMPPPPKCRPGGAASIFFGRIFQ